MRNTLTCLFVIQIFVMPLSGRADLHECNGTWTNLPCDGNVGKTMSETEGPAHARSDSVPPTGSNQNVPEPLAPRLELIRKLRKLSDEYRKGNGISLGSTELDTFRRLCEDRSKPFEECSKAYDTQRERLISQNQTKEKIELDAERNRIEADKVDAIRRR